LKVRGGKVHFNLNFVLKRKKRVTERRREGKGMHEEEGKRGEEGKKICKREEGAGLRGG